MCPDRIQGITIDKCILPTVTNDLSLWFMSNCKRRNLLCVKVKFDMSFYENHPTIFAGPTFIIIV